MAAVLGLVGSKTMAQLFDVARQQNARVILSGDRAQHGSVERGAALRLLETDAGIVPADLKDIQRQKGEYREAVRSLGEGRTAQGFQALDRLGWVREISGTERYKAMAADYVASVEQGKTALVVSPTHAEGDRITQEIRDRLKAAGRIDSEERVFRMLENANLTESERTDGVNYLPGDVLVYHQNSKTHGRGDRVTVGDESIPKSEAWRFQVFHPKALTLSRGDTIRITRNGQTADGEHRLNNGAMYTIKGFTRTGDLILNNKWIIDKDFGFFTHGYVVTSHASQGKTIENVYIGQSSTSFPASSREQFYVSVSRGRERATIYTDDKDSLLEAVSHSDERIAASDLFTGARQHPTAIQRMKANERLDAYVPNTRQLEREAVLER